MGIPNAAFRASDLYIEYVFEEVLFRYENESGRFFCKFYTDIKEHERNHDNRLLNDAILSGVLTTAERYLNGGGRDHNPTAETFSRVAVNFQRTKPYWIGVIHHRDYTRSGEIEVAANGFLEVIEAAAPVESLLERTVTEINSQPVLSVAFGGAPPITVDRQSKDYDLALRLELKRHELSVSSESSYYRGRSEE